MRRVETVPLACSPTVPRRRSLQPPRARRPSAQSANFAAIRAATRPALRLELDLAATCSTRRWCARRTNASPRTVTRCRPPSVARGRGGDSGAQRVRGRGDGRGDARGRGPCAGRRRSRRRRLAHSARSARSSASSLRRTPPQPEVLSRTASSAWPLKSSRTSHLSRGCPREIAKLSREIAKLSRERGLRRHRRRVNDAPPGRLVPQVDPPPARSIRRLRVSYSSSFMLIREHTSAAPGRS